MAECLRGVASPCIKMPPLPDAQLIEDMMENRAVSPAVSAMRRLIDQVELEPVTPGAKAFIAA